jgi:hypothetical protein
VNAVVDGQIQSLDVDHLVHLRCYCSRLLVPRSKATFDCIFFASPEAWGGLVSVQILGVMDILTSSQVIPLRVWYSVPVFQQSATRGCFRM